jgi:hypothetical protein
VTVQELFDIMLPRLSGPAKCTIFEAVREVQGIIVNRLLLRRPQMLKKTYDFEVSFEPGESETPLPSDFRTMDGRPYVAGDGALEPLGRISPARLSTAGKIQYFEQPGRLLRVYPPPQEATTVRVPYIAAPPVLTKLEDALPFRGEFDSVFVEGAAAMASAGLSAVADRGFVATIQSHVDMAIEARNLHDEQQMADDINGL